MARPNFRINEFNIPVPWGHIAVKTQGDETDPPILYVHGRLDNAGGFDQLVSSLPHQFYHICIDLPGHGRSSHFPPHVPIHSLDFLLAFMLVVEHFKISRLIIIGHSYGAQLGMLFARLYPEKVEKLIMLDAFHLYTIEVEETKKYILNRLEKHLEWEKKVVSKQQPRYSYEEAYRRVSTNRENAENLTPAAAEALLKRGLDPTDDGKYTFTVDQRMKYYINPIHDIRFAMESFQHDPVVCPVLIIFAKLNYLPRAKFNTLLEELQQNCPNISICYVDGGHDVHNNNPERLVPHINKFLLPQKGKL